MASSILSIIEQCWPEIELYADLETSLTLAETCSYMHKLIIDAHTNKLKVSHFEVDNTPFNSSLSFDEENREPIKKNWQTAPSRIPFFLSRALNNIHFQSLERISIDFPATKRRNNSPSSIIDDAFSTSFPIFVTNVAHARNLQYLHFNASRIMTNERSGMLESLYEILSDNLSCCKKLKDLDIFNIGYIRGYDNPFYSVSLLLAIMPAIKRNKLNRLRIVLAGQPSDPLYDRL